mmetsp:Transcript_62226/g.109627  ORF Transcript_62226/g.109627 Transcript_62226/m.109627 type:complete len:274 (-) Transcript_62226:1597-2418(-)
MCVRLSQQRGRTLAGHVRSALARLSNRVVQLVHNTFFLRAARSLVASRGIERMPHGLMARQHVQMSSKEHGQNDHKQNARSHETPELHLLSHFVDHEQTVVDVVRVAVGQLEVLVGPTIREEHLTVVHLPLHRRAEACEQGVKHRQVAVGQRDLGGVGLGINEGDDQGDVVAHRVREVDRVRLGGGEGLVHHLVVHLQTLVGLGQETSLRLHIEVGLVLGLVGVETLHGRHQSVISVQEMGQGDKHRHTCGGSGVLQPTGAEGVELRVGRVVR